MKVSSRTEYGMRAMLELAYHYDDGGPMMLQRIARNQDIPEKYLEQLFIKLRKAKLIKGRRGPSGGYFLTRCPSEIDLCEVMEALDGPIRLAKCIAEPSTCERSGSCAIQELWGQINHSIRSTLGGTSLAQLCQRQQDFKQPLVGLPTIPMMSCSETKEFKQNAA